MSAGTAGFAHPEFLVETEELAAQLDDPELRIFDCTIHLIPNPDIGYTVKPGREDFEKGHIPGAQFIDLQGDLSAPHPKLRFMLPSAADFAAVMGRFGVGDRARVILYSTTTPQWATRVWWMLRNYGFDNAAVLNGGFQKWAREGRAIETGPARPRPPAHFTAREDRKLMVGKEAVLGAVGEPLTCTINAFFMPAGDGPKSASVNIVSNGPISPLMVSLSGTGGIPAPAISPSATSLPFGTEALGFTTAAQNLIVTNSGTAPLTVSSVNVAGANPASFSATNGCTASVAAGASCTIAVTFHPAGLGAKAATVVIDSNAASSPTDVTLSGTGAADAPRLTLIIPGNTFPPGLAFGNQGIGSRSAPLVVKVENTGTATLVISSATLGGANTPSFALTNGCTSSLAPSASCNLSTTFAPGGAGLKSADLIIASNASGPARQIGITGTGVVPAPAIAVSPASLMFNYEKIGTTSGMQTLTVTNTGGAALTISSVTLGGANQPAFQISNGCATPVAAGDTCSISVTFDSPGAGNKSAQLTIVSNAPGSPTTIAMTGLSGSGAVVAFSISSGASSRFSAIKTRHSRSLSLTARTSCMRAGSSDFAPGSNVRRRV